MQAQLSAAQQVNRAIINSILDQVEDTIFGVEFVKKDGSIRKMQARRHVLKTLTGAGDKYGEEAKAKYIKLFDMAKGEYRAVNRDTIRRVSLRGNVYEVVSPL